MNTVEWMHELRQQVTAEYGNSDTLVYLAVEDGSVSNRLTLIIILDGVVHRFNVYKNDLQDPAVLIPFCLHELKINQRDW